MLVLLEGSAAVESVKGVKLGSVFVGAAVDEVVALGLLPTRPSTLRASEPCRLLIVTASALQRAFNNASEEVRAMFNKLVGSRQDAVMQGFPMTAMNIGVKNNCLATRAIALHALSFTLKPGQVLEMLPDEDPNGQHFVVLVRGKAVLEMPMWHPDPEATPRVSKAAGENNAVPVMPVTLGFPLFEGMAAEFCTQVRAETSCQGFRVRLIDFAACALLLDKLEWMPRFRMLEIDAKKTLDRRCSASRGIVEGLAPHPSDANIHIWRERRISAIARIKSQKHPDGGSPSLTPLGAPQVRLAADMLRERMHPDHPGRRRIDAPGKGSRRPTACLEAMSPMVADPHDGQAALAMSPTPSGKLSRSKTSPDLRGSKDSARTQRSSKTQATRPTLSRAKSEKVARAVEEEEEEEFGSSTLLPKAPSTPMLPIMPLAPLSLTDRKKRRPKDQEYYEEKEKRRQERLEEERLAMGLAPSSELKPSGPSNRPAEVKSLFSELEGTGTEVKNQQMTSLPKLGPR